jgi:hypothetical protein
MGRLKEYVYTLSCVKGGDSAKHTSTFFYTVYTRIWILTHMGYIQYYVRTAYAGSITYHGITFYSII